MKLKGLVFIWLLCFPVILGFSQENQRQQYVRLSWDYINQIRNLPNNDLSDLDFLLSSSFVLNVKSNNQNNAEKIIGIENGEVQFGQEKTNVRENIEINNKEYIGKLHYISDSQRGRETIEIFFSKKGSDEIITMKFARDRNDLFTFISAVVDNELYIPNSAASLPHLIIGSNAKPKIETITIVPGDPNFSGTTFPIPASISTSSARSSESLIGKGFLTKNDINIIINLILSRNTNVNRGYAFNLLTVYFDETLEENINADIAIAQMLHNTNFLRNQSRVNTHNYAGFDVSTTPNKGYWNRGFNNMTIGVRAHIQHIKGYASNAMPRKEIVDPRWENISNLRGSAHTLDDMTGRWAPSNPNYANSIRRIIDDLRRNQNRSI